jgi:transposase InsO family protein
MIGRVQAALPQYPLSALCAIFGDPRSSYYYASMKVKTAEAVLVNAIERVLMRYPFYGYRRVLAQLVREGWTVGETRVRRLLAWLGRTRTVGQVRVQTTDSRHQQGRYPNLIGGVRATCPNQVWVADITYIRLGTRFLYLAVVLDACSRAVRGWCLSRTLAQDITLSATRMALAHGAPFIFHADQGSQYAAWLHTDLLLGAGVHISMSDLASPTQNGIAERFMRTLKEEHVDYTEYRDFDDAQRQLAHWLEVEYNTCRVHSALGYATPAEYEGASRYPLLS